jgi:DNA polymerase-1
MITGNCPVKTELGNQVRYGFIPEPGHVLASLDFSQIEMVWTAHLSKDPFMCDVFRVPGPDGKPRDIHSEGAARMFKIALEQVDKRLHRLPAKSLNFGIVYGILAPSLQLQILAAGGPLIPIEELAQMIEDWFGVFPGVRRLMENTFDRVRRWNMCWTAFGRVRLIPQVVSSIPRIVRKGLREAGNHPVQGSAGDHIKIAMAEIWDTLVVPLQEMGETAWPLLQIHDELIFELSPSIASDFCGMAREIMEKSVPLEVPVKSSADWGEQSWGSLK